MKPPRGSSGWRRRSRSWRSEARRKSPMQALITRLDLMQGSDWAAEPVARECAPHNPAPRQARGLEIGRFAAAIAAQEGSQGCERFLRAPLVCVVSWKRAASAALDGVPDGSSAADAAQNHDIFLPGVLAKNARTPGYRLVAANAAKKPRFCVGLDCRPRLRAAYLPAALPNLVASAPYN